MSAKLVGQCSHMVERNGVMRLCKNRVAVTLGDASYCSRHAPKIEPPQWSDQRYRRIVHQGGSRLIALGSAVPDTWQMVAMSHREQDDGTILIMLEKVG